MTDIIRRDITEELAMVERAKHFRELLAGFCEGCGWTIEPGQASGDALEIVPLASGEQATWIRTAQVKGGDER